MLNIICSKNVILIPFGDPACIHEKAGKGCLVICSKDCIIIEPSLIMEARKNYPHTTSHTNI